MIAKNVFCKKHSPNYSPLEGGVIASNKKLTSNARVISYVNFFLRIKAHPPNPPQGGNIKFTALVLLAICFLCISQAHAQTAVPYLSGRVNDYANLLSPNTAAELEAELKAHEDSTSNQVVVLTIPSLEGAVLEEYSIEVVETWKLGRAEKDNGVLLLIARDDRKVRIEVGNGLEGNLPDITCGRIIRNEIVSRFKEGNYEAGVRNGVHAILAAIQGAYVAGEAESANAPDWKFCLLFFGIFIIVVGVFTFISVVAGSAGWFLYFFLMPFWLAFPMVSFGVVGGGILFGLYVIGIGALKLWLKKSPAGQVTAKKWEKKWAGSQLKRGRGGSWGGSSWSSSSWSSSSSSSSFSGGGGSFSGGGASGSW